MRLFRRSPLAHTAERISRSLPPELTLQPHLPSSIRQQVLEAKLHRTETELQGLIEQEVATIKSRHVENASSRT